MAVGVVVRACSYSDPEAIETLESKSEWSSLQVATVRSKNDPLIEPVVHQIGDLEVLGVKGAAGENIWILLRAASPPFYKQLPDGQYDLPVALVEKLEKEGRVSYTVGTVLRSHVRLK